MHINATTTSQHQYNTMHAGSASLCLLLVWCAGAGGEVSAPRACSTVYHHGGHDYYCEPDVDGCQTKYVQYRFIMTDEYAHLMLKKEDTCILCLPTCCSQKPFSPGACSEVRLNNSLEFFGFNEIEKAWERLTTEDSTYVLLDTPSFNITYFGKIRDYTFLCTESIDDYGAKLVWSICSSALAKGEHCTDGKLYDGAMCVNKTTIGY